MKILLASSLSLAGIAHLLRKRAKFSSSQSIIVLANEAPADLQFIGAANTYALDADGWLTIPYGDSKHSGADGLKPARPGEAAPQPVVQRLTREDAVALVNDFKSGWSRFKRAIVGLPIFKGHPDAPRYSKKYPDKNPRGQIADMEAGERGLRLKPVLSEQGAKDVEAGWSETSPFWALRKSGEEAGAIIAHPFRLFSLGLVPEGNIQGLSLTNAAEPQTENKTTMILLLVKLLAALGITLAADAPEADASTAVDQAIQKIKDATGAKEQLATANGKVTDLEGKVTNLTNEKETLTTRAATAESNFQKERKARALALVNVAIVEGRVAAASRDAEALALANSSDFDAAASALSQRPKAIKTESQLGKVSQAVQQQQDRQQQVIGLVNEAMETPKIKALPTDQRYDAAFNSVRKDPKNASLFPAKS